MKGNSRPFFLIITILTFGFFFSSCADDQNSADSTEYRVIQVIDGDTIIIDDARRSSVRYLGIDTPEIAHQGAAGEPLSEEARDYNERLVGGKKVRLEFDQEKYDHYGRILAHVYVEGEFVNLALIEKGLATDLIIEPNIKHRGEILKALDKAKKQRLGIWDDLDKMEEPWGNSQHIIPLESARSYAGKQVVVEGVVTEVSKSEKVIKLKMGDRMHLKIFENDWDNFEHFGIQPEIYYKGKRVRAIGRIRVYKNTPGMVVGHPIAIRIVE